MAINNVADLFVATLEQAGVKRIYGIVGDSLNGFTEALRRRGTIEWIHVRHEEVAAFAAAGEAEMTGSLAVSQPMFAHRAHVTGWSRRPTWRSTT